MIICTVYHLHQSPQGLRFNIQDIEDTVLLSCADALTLGTVLPSDKLDRKIPICAKLVISQGNRYDVYVNNKVNKQSQSDESSQAVVHTKEDVMSLLQDCFTGLGKFQDEPYHIEAKSSMSHKKIPCRPISIH